MFCVKCGAYVVNGQNFCKKCGAPMVKEESSKTCSSCGAALKSRQLFCTRCGTRWGSSRRADKI